MILLLGGGFAWIVIRFMERSSRDSVLQMRFNGKRYLVFLVIGLLYLSWVRNLRHNLMGKLAMMRKLILH